MGTQPRESACASSHTMKPKQGNKSKGRKRIAKSHSKPKPTSSQRMNLNQEPPTGQDALPTVPIQNPLSNENSSSSMEKTTGEKGKPPKPLPLTTSISHMPYVTTKGKNGKTVNGFLYRYNKSEVSIVCVCHGSTFSPAAFVQHAGGTDIRNPLRLITVIPSALG